MLIGHIEQLQNNSETKIVNQDYLSSSRISSISPVEEGLEQRDFRSITELLQESMFQRVRAQPPQQSGLRSRVGYGGGIYQLKILIQFYNKSTTNMGIDLIRGGRIANRGFRATKSSNAYLKSLIKLYSFLTRRTESKFNEVVHKRLNQSRLNRYPLSISRIARHLGKDRAAVAEGQTKYNSRIVAIVGTVTNDVRLLNVPQGLRVAALKFTTAARKRIVAAGGQAYTFDQLAQLAPTGKGVLLLRGPRDREAKRHFGLYPGQKGSHTAPRVRAEGRKFERARGRR